MAAASGRDSTRMDPNQFETLRKLGSGAFSTVYASKYAPDGKIYAVKVLRDIDAGGDPELKRALDATKRESRVLLMCNHPNIVMFHASLKSGSERFYVMELCEGGSLTSLLQKKRRIPVAAARYITAQLGAALHYLHDAPKQVSLVAQAEKKQVLILHRDLKPDNVVFTRDRQVKLIDFGASWMPAEFSGEGGTKDDRPKTFTGTIQYMAPEMHNENQAFPATDFWSLGCILFEMLTGVHPFLDRSGAYQTINAICCNPPPFDRVSLDPHARSLLEGLLNKDPAMRICGDRGFFDHPFFQEKTKEYWIKDVDTAPLWVHNAEWETDGTTSSCRVCSSSFTLLRRKHHCRYCGRLVCASCSDHMCLIPDSTYRAAERVCDECFALLSSP